MSNQTKSPAPCDCLNWCGDDPWLRDGRAAPCEKRVERDEVEARAMDRAINTRRLLEELGHAGDTLAALQELRRLRGGQAGKASTTVPHLVVTLRRLMRAAVDHCDPIKIEDEIHQAAAAIEAAELD